MANVTPEWLDKNFYENMLRNQLWQSQLSNGANIANMGGRTALGLAIGTGLGNWLGYKFGNWQRARDDAKQYQIPPTAQTAINNLLGDEFDLGWKPQYQFKTPKEYLLEAVKYNPNWREVAYSDALPKYQAAMTGFLSPRPQTQQTIAPAVSEPPQPVPVNSPTATTPQQNYSWGYRPLTEGSLKPKPAMSISEAIDNVLPYYGLSRW